MDRPCRNQYFSVQSYRAPLHKKSPHSTEGAEYESQGQARSEAERVAPGGDQRER